MKTLLQSFLLVFSLATINIYAQTGPGGVGDATTNILWLDASKLNLNNGDPVSNWTDVSGNSNNAVQTNATNQPTFVSSAINGMPGISFDGVNDYLDLSNHITETEQSIFAVNKFGTPSNWSFLYTSYGGDLMSNKSYHFGYYAAGNFLDAGAYSVGQSKIISVLLDASLSKTTKTGNNNSWKTHAYPATCTFSRSAIGAAYNTTYNYFLFHSGISPEIIVYNYRLNEAQKIIVNNYLAAKYKLSISNDYYSFDADFGQELAGIGQSGGESHTVARGTSDIEISNPTSLNDNDFLMWGHDTGNYSLNYSDLPPGLSGARWNRLWRIDERGSVGNYDVRIYLNSNTIGTNNNQYYLIYDQNNGLFIDGSAGYFGPGIYDSNTNSVLFSNVNIPDNAWFTLANTSETIISVASGDWSNPSVWSCNCVPDSTMNVTVSTGDLVQITQYQSIYSIEVKSGATLEIVNTNTLSIKGDFTLKGDFIKGQGTLKFSNTNTVQNIRNDNTSNVNLDVYNYEQTNPNAVWLRKGNFRIENRFSVKAGSFVNKGSNYVVFLSDSLKSSYIDEVLSSSSTPISGNNIRMVRYITARPDAWSDIASASTNATFGQLDQKLYFSGIGGNDGNVTDGSGTIKYSAFNYNAALQQYDTVKTTTRVLNPAEGFEIWLADDMNSYYGGLFYVDGIPNTGNISAAPYLPANAGEWALIGNPYMSWIEWASVTKTGLPNEVWIYEASAGNYVLHNSGNVAIPPMQGFWVQASANNPTATFTESSKIPSNSSTFYKNGQGIKSFALTLKENNTGYYQTCYIRKDVTATIGYDAGKDATLLPSKNKKAPVFTLVDNQSGKNLMLNYINVKQHEIEIPLFVSVKETGMVTISAENMDYIKENYNYVELIDLYNHKVYNLDDNDNLEFYLTKGDYAGRFYLRLSDTSSDANNSKDLVYISGNTIQVKMQQNTLDQAVQIIVMDAQGRIVFEKQNVNQPVVQLPLSNNISSGTYFVRIIKANNVETHKLILNK
jgi:hypothetical protein